MIVYADTSALVKLFVTETGSSETRHMLQDASVIGVSLLARAELGAALARGSRRGVLTSVEAAAARQQLAQVWPTWAHLSVDEKLVAQAEALAWTHGLRGYDAVHLAAALLWQQYLGQSITLATFDQELWTAARQVGVTAWPDILT